MVRGNLSFDVAHLLAGSLVLVSFMQLYQTTLRPSQCICPARSGVGGIGWLQALVQDAPHLYSLP